MKTQRIRRRTNVLKSVEGNYVPNRLLYVPVKEINGLSVAIKFKTKLDSRQFLDYITSKHSSANFE